MWGDIMYAAAANIPELFAYYYNSVPDGAINDRCGTEFSIPLRPGMNPPEVHYDFLTPEYSSFDDIEEQKFQRSASATSRLCRAVPSASWVSRGISSGRKTVTTWPFASLRTSTTTDPRGIGVGTAWLREVSRATFAEIQELRKAAVVPTLAA